MLTVIGKGFSAAFGWMLKNPVVVLLVVFTGMFAMITVSKNSEIATLSRTSAEKDQRIETLVGSLAQARGNVATLSASLKAQNAALDSLLGRAEVADAKFDVFMADLSKGNASLTKRLAAIDAAQPGSDPCKSAYELIQGSLK